MNGALPENQRSEKTKGSYHAENEAVYINFSTKIHWSIKYFERLFYPSDSVTSYTDHKKKYWHYTGFSNAFNHIVHLSHICYY